MAKERGMAKEWPFFSVTTSPTKRVTPEADADAAEMSAPMVSSTTQRARCSAPTRRSPARPGSCAAWHRGV